MNIMHQVFKNTSSMTPFYSIEGENWKMEDEKVDKERYVVSNEQNVEKSMNDKMEGSEPENGGI